MISARGYSLRLYQTAIQGLSLPAPFSGGRLPVLAPGALETHACPTSAIQIDSSRSLEAGSLGSSSTPGQRTLGLSACATGARDTAHAAGRRDAGSARSPAGRAPR